MIRVVALATLLLASTAQAMDVDLEPFRESRRSGALGAVSGRVYTDSRAPRGPVRPMTGTTVTLLPRSAGLLAKLDRLKGQARESSTAFTAAAPAMRKAKEDYERELLHAGAPDLAPMVLVDQDGGFKIEEVPAGTWMLLAWHSVAADVSTTKTKARERNRYLPQPRLHGFQSVTVWLREVPVGRGSISTVDLTDRNAWFDGVIEERELDAGR